MSGVAIGQPALSCQNAVDTRDKAGLDRATHQGGVGLTHRCRWCITAISVGGEDSLEPRSQKRRGGLNVRRNFELMLSLSPFYQVSIKMLRIGRGQLVRQMEPASKTDGVPRPGCPSTFPIARRD